MNGSVKMLKILLNGCCGKMGHKIAEIIALSSDVKIIEGVDISAKGDYPFPVYSSFKDVCEKPDVIIDFSNPVVLDDLIAYATEKKVPTVIATTGYTDAQIEKIKALSLIVPVFFAFNMSIGINVLESLAKKAATILGDYDVEIIEKHHNQKLDAPSGTAIMLANAINDARGNSMIYEYDRHSKRQKRSANEIGVHSVRGGTIVGEHEVIFAGKDEVISIKHEAFSRDIFANGAIKAARFLSGKKPGLYDMNDML